MMTGIYKTAKKINVTLKWLNFQSESHQPYDIELVKTKESELPQHRFIEAKATTGSTIHFLLSENEWNLMNTRPDAFRLYHIMNAGQLNAKVLPIRDRSDDIDRRKYIDMKKYAVTEHHKISYEINPL